ncbi:aspartate/tyrosine/aromatic aminotransferase [Phycisphaeraceae bacterium D3-23]
MAPTPPTTRTSPTMFDSVQPAPPDAIIGLTEAYKADPNPAKINLAVGVYKDAEGQTPTLGAVREAEQWLLANEPNKVYLGIDGSPGYGQRTRDLLLGSASELAQDAEAGGRSATFQAPGGTGALRNAADYLAANHAGAGVWLSAPTWPNHPSIFQAAGLGVKTYPYLDTATNALAFDAMLEALQAVQPGDVVLLHGCCHNPTGVDPSPQQWQAIGELLNERGAMPLVDFAYQGFAAGVEEDAAGLRTLARQCGELIVCNSYSKNFGLYRERVGAMTVVASSNASAKAVQSQVKACIRRNYSNPPAHGALVVEHILGSDELTARWLEELAAMRERVARMRHQLRTSLDERGISLGSGGNAFIEQQNGMFTMSGLTKPQVERLRAEHSIYIVGSGRINVAGMTAKNMPTLCDAIASVV